MCDACRAKGENYVFKNKDSSLYSNRLYNINFEGVGKIELCRLHDIELFRNGEYKFLSKNYLLAKRLLRSNRSFL